MCHVFIPQQASTRRYTSSHACSSSGNKPRSSYICYNINVTCARCSYNNKLQQDSTRPHMHVPAAATSHVQLTSAMTFMLHVPCVHTATSFNKTVHVLTCMFQQRQQATFSLHLV